MVHSGFGLGVPCGETAFYLKHRPFYDETLNPQDVISKNGKKPKKGDRVVCSSCGKIVSMSELEVEGGLKE